LNPHELKKGIIIGRFLGYSKRGEKEMIKIIKERTSDYNFPVLINVDIGHNDLMIPLPIGVKTRIDYSKNLF
jgi:muramoyltetrapeptide carboxypeptidase LdcA involved in peptidoglycan recycling